MTTDNALSEVKLKANDYASNQEVRWCPGCGDYAILAQNEENDGIDGGSRARTSCSSQGSDAPAVSRTT